MAPEVRVGDVVDYNYSAFFGTGDVVSTEAVVTAVYDVKVGHVQLRYNVFSNTGARVEPRRVSVMHSDTVVPHSWTRVIRLASTEEPQAEPPKCKSRKRRKTLQEEYAELDDAMTKLKKHRAALISQARAVAIELASAKGTVTSTDVFRVLEDRGVDLGEHDTRWMGAVFNSKTWALVDYRPQGSHGRKVSVWALK